MIRTSPEISQNPVNLFDLNSHQHNPLKMILRSGKALIKRSKHSSAVNEEQGREDMISKLPEALLIYILSLLTEPVDAIRTCILSNRWKHLWVFLPNLYFALPCSSHSVEQVDKFHDSVDNALALREGMPIRGSFLSCLEKYDYDRVLNSLRIVVHSKLEILELNFPTDSYKIRLSWDLLKNCNTLIELTMKGGIKLDLPEADVFLFLYLKKVNLISVYFLGDQSPHNLISRCPILEELSLERQGFHSGSRKIKISLPHLKRLGISVYHYVREVVIDAPKLEYLYIEDAMHAKYSLTNPLSLSEVHIN